MKIQKEIFTKLEKETNAFLHFLQECKYSGSWDTKVDLNTVIMKIANYQFYVKSLLQEVEELENKIKELGKGTNA